MKKVSLTFALTIFLLQPMFVSAEETCVELTAPGPLVADFDANGVVNRRDMAIFEKVIRKNKRIERRNRIIERYNSRRSKQHRGEERSNSRRLKELQQIIYSPMFDRNTDQEIDASDRYMATLDMGKPSTEEDRKLANIYIKILAGTYSCVEATVKIEADEDAAAAAAALLVGGCGELDPMFCLN